MYIYESHRKSLKNPSEQVKRQIVDLQAEQPKIWIVYL